MDIYKVQKYSLMFQYLWLIILLVLCIAILAAHHGQQMQIIGGFILKDLAKHPRTRSEQNVINIFEKITGASFPTIYPPWLKWKGRPMELDGYNDKLKIAVEFSGPLHTKYYPEKETYAMYKERVEKDREKIRLCEKNNVKLIVIDMNVPMRHLYDYINSRLYDIGVIKERPFNYMIETLATPYENPQVEKYEAARRN